MIFLDTNTCIYALKMMFPRIIDNLKKHLPIEIKIPAIVKAELMLGAEKSNAPLKTYDTIMQFLAPFEVIPFDTKSADVYGKIRAQLEKQGQTIGPNDYIIASTVLSQNGILITRNTKEFNRIPNLEARDWT